GLNVLHAHNGDDVARGSEGQFVTVVSVHFHHTANTLGLAGERVEDGVTLVQVTGVDAAEGQGAETVVHDLEGQSAEGLVSRDDGVLAGRVTFFVGQRLRVNLSRRRQVVNNGVEQQLHAFVLERGAAVGREERQFQSALADAA